MHEACKENRGRRWVAGGRTTAILFSCWPFFGKLDLDLSYTKLIFDLQKIEYICNSQINSYRIERNFLCRDSEIIVIGLVLFRSISIEQHCCHLQFLGSQWVRISYENANWKKMESFFKNYFNTLWYTYALPGRRAILRKTRRCAKQILAWCWDGIDYATMYTMQQYQLGYRGFSYMNLQIFKLLADQLLTK